MSDQIRPRLRGLTARRVYCGRFSIVVNLRCHSIDATGIAPTMKGYIREDLMNDLHEVLSTLNKEYISIGECVNLCKRSACSERLHISYGKYSGMR